MLLIFKALSSEVRLNILQWLKEPKANFPPDEHGDGVDGICVGQLQKRAGLSASATSTHIAVLQRAGLVLPTRVGQWTFYRRNEEALAAFARAVGTEL
ncbi:ArsR/SmtB family transcription factor [Agrobacterium tumefaciens]|uniref:ArsR/SmtB family transcription factor n=1 Tax=Agrobacterium tumefaciens TaxID=358 RepID=UPI001BADDE33|nr:metalloregulator ArsR/SmtB family transcription factor [Agrobacterium tumefaciens]